MTRTELDRTDTYSSHTIIAVCDRCKAGCGPTRRNTVSADQWDSRMATLEAVRLGWVERIEGRMLRLYCSDCRAAIGA